MHSSVGDEQAQDTIKIVLNSHPYILVVDKLQQKVDGRIVEVSLRQKFEKEGYKIVEITIHCESALRVYILTNSCAHFLEVFDLLLAQQ